jgi:hypothetical protein
MTTSRVRRAGFLLIGAAVAGSLGLAGPGPRVEVAADSAAAPGQETTTTEETTTTTEETTTTEPPETTTTEEQSTTEPPEEDTTVPATDATTPDGDEGDEGSDIDWGLIGLIAAIVAVVALLAALIAGRARARRQAREEERRRLAHLVGGARWVHDQASLELLGGAQSPERLQASWADVRRRINDLAAQASEASVGAGDEVAADVRRLGRALGDLESALDTNVELRVRPAGGPGTMSAVDESGAVVNERRHELHAAIEGLAARV